MSKPKPIRIIVDYGYCMHVEMQDYIFPTEYFSGKEAEEIRKTLRSSVD